VNTNNTPDQNSAARSVVENAREIEITKRIVRFGSSVYQFKNVTGFKVDKVPKWKFPLQVVLTLTAFGVFSIFIANAITTNEDSSNLDSFVGFLAVLGSCLIIIDFFIVIVWLCQRPPRAFILYLNSGHERMFLSHDKIFLMKIVNALYDFMKSDDHSSLSIDMSDRSIKVDGNFYGEANTGNKNMMF
jgi:hypothetical protein